MKKINKLESAYNKVFRVVKNLDDVEMNRLLDAVCAGWEAWRSLSVLKEAEETETYEDDPIDDIEEDLAKRSKKK